MNRMGERIAKLEGRAGAASPYFITDQPDGQAKPAERYSIGREMTVEEWVRAHVVQAN